MYSNFDKRQELARQTQTFQTFRRIRRGIGAVHNSRAKLVLLASLWMMAGIIWLTRHPMMGYGSAALFAPVLDALTVVVLLLLTAALSLALLWAWGGPWQAGWVQDNLLRIGLTNSAGEPPTLLSVTTNPGNPILSSIIIDSPSAAELIPKNSKGLFVLNDSSGKDTSATVFKSYILPDGAD